MSLNLAAIFDLETRGLISLPPTISELRAKLEVLRAAPLPPSPHPAVLVDDLIAQTIAAAASGDVETVDFSAPHQAEVAAKVHQQRIEVIVAATETVQSRLNSAVHAASTTIVKAMQPAFDKAISELRGALEMAAQWPNPAGALTAPQKVRAALASQFSLREQVDAMLAARATLSRLGYRSSVDEVGEFGLVRNFHELWPRNARQIRRAPWSDAPDLVTWYLTNGGDLWLPTLDQQDAQYDAAYGEAIREQTYRVQSMRALASQIGGGDRIAGPSNVRQQPTTEAGPTPTQVAHQRLFGTAPAEPVPAA